MAVIAAGLLGLIAILATLQYRWLGRISDAERERMTATLDARAAAFAQDFDRELTLAYAIFQIDSISRTSDDPGLAARFTSRYERWQAAARHPRLIKDYYVTSREDAGPPQLLRFEPGTHLLTPVAEWPASLSGFRQHLLESMKEPAPDGGIVIRTMPGILWEDVPAIVVPMSTAVLFGRLSEPHPSPRLDALLSYAVLVLDRDFITTDLFPALAQQHFRGDELDYQLAVVGTSGNTALYQSTPSFRPMADAKADARADLFQVRPQDFAQMIADMRRLSAALQPPGLPGVDGPRTVTTFALPIPEPVGVEQYARRRQPGTPPADSTRPGDATPRLFLRDALPPSVVVDRTTKVDGRAVFTSVTGAIGRTAPARWRLLVKHPAGSLEVAVNSVRRRNLFISTGILGVLAASLVLVVLSTRRSQQLARQQMEFVAAVSHELRTPLAVIRSAGENLADGVVKEEAQIRKYGALVKGEGRRLTEMVEQILEFSGLQSGQRMLQAVPVRLDELIAQVLRASDTLIDEARLRVEVAIPADLPAVAGDEAALRRVFQNLVGNAIKYGADGGWIGVSASAAGSEVRISVKDRGIGIAPADQARIFEPFYRAADVVAAQVQGAGLGLSLVHRIVSAHGGRIAVQSVKGSGSEFVVHLPIASGRPGASAAASQLRTGAAGPTPTAHVPRVP
jgi:signal transduction histidine kinase